MRKTPLVPSAMKAQPLPWGTLTSHSLFLLCHHARGSSSSPLVLPFPLRLFSFSPSPPPASPFSPQRLLLSLLVPSPSFSLRSFLSLLFLLSLLGLLRDRSPSSAPETQYQPPRYHGRWVCVGGAGKGGAKGGKHGQQLCACAFCGRARETPGGGSDSGPGGGAWVLGGGAWLKSCRIWAWSGQRQIS